MLIQEAVRFLGERLRETVEPGSSALIGLIILAADASFIRLCIVSNESPSDNEPDQTRPRPSSE